MTGEVVHTGDAGAPSVRADRLPTFSYPSIPPMHMYLISR